MKKKVVQIYHIRETAIDSIIKHLRMSMNINNSAWIRTYRKDITELESNFQEQLVSKLKSLTRKCKQIPLSLDNYVNSLRNIELIVTDMRGISNNLGQMAFDVDGEILDDMIKDAVDVLSDRSANCTVDHCFNDFNLRHNNKANIQVRKDYLELRNITILLFLAFTD